MGATATKLVEHDWSAALREIDALGPRTTAGRNALVALARSGMDGADMLARLDKAVTAPLNHTATDVGLLLAHAQSAWNADQRNPVATRTRDSARRLIELVPELPEGFRLLGLAHLSRSEYTDAFLTFSALKSLPSAQDCDKFHTLARCLMNDIHQVSFTLAGERFTFDLATHNATAIESSAFHSIGMIENLDALQALQKIINRPQYVTEVGALLGNGAAYLLKVFAPRRLTLIDADRTNIPFIRRTAACNLPQGPGMDVIIHHAFAGDRSDAVMYAGKPVACRRLDQLTQDAVDLLKIDVDDDGLAVLSGAASIIDSQRPAVMITTADEDAVRSWFATRNYNVRHVCHAGSRHNIILTPS